MSSALRVLPPSEPFEYALPRRPMPILMQLMVLSLWTASTGITIAGIWAIIGWLW